MAAGAESPLSAASPRSPLSKMTAMAAFGQEGGVAVRKAFDVIDTDMSGRVDFKELGLLLEALGRAAVTQAVSACDKQCWSYTSIIRRVIDPF